MDIWQGALYFASYLECKKGQNRTPQNIVPRVPMSAKAIVPQGFAGNPAFEEALLGLPLLGQRVIFDYEWHYHTGRRASIFGMARHKFYRHQSVVI